MNDIYTLAKGANLGNLVAAISDHSDEEIIKSLNRNFEFTLSPNDVEIIREQENFSVILTKDTPTPPVLLRDFIANAEDEEAYAAGEER